MTDATGADATRTNEVRTTDALPMLDAAEHAWIEERVGRKLTNEQAQIILRSATLEAAFNEWTKNHT